MCYGVAVSGRPCHALWELPALCTIGSKSGEKLWQAGLLEYDEKIGLDWEWQSMDGAMTKAALGKKG